MIDFSVILYNQAGYNRVVSQPEYVKGSLEEFTEDYLTDGSEAAVIAYLEYCYGVLVFDNPKSRKFPSTRIYVDNGVPQGGTYYASPETFDTTFTSAVTSWFQTIVLNWAKTKGLVPETSTGGGLYLYKVTFTI